MTSIKATEDVRVEEATADGRLLVTFCTADDVYERVRLSLRGRHQLTNAAVAIALAETLRRTRGFPFTRAAIIEGLQMGRTSGRLELHETRPALLFDGAHNPAGAQALRAYLDEFVSAPVTLVFGAMADKQLDEIAATLFPVAARIVLTQPTNPRAATLDVLAQLAQRYAHQIPFELAMSPARALKRAQELTPPAGLVCITGSLYLIGEIKQLLADESGS